MGQQKIHLASPVIILLMSFVWSSRAASKDYYVAAVYEHSRIDEGSPETVIESNLEYYRTAAAVAKTKGADIVVFPEYGIFRPNNREELKKFVEYIPNPRENIINPCKEASKYSSSPILYALSCIARDNSMVVVANTGEIQLCKGNQSCRSDGVFLFNTNIAFDRDGKLLAKYNKEHLYFELGMDLPIEQQDPTFKTDFGKFAMFVCFDIIFKKISEVASLKEIDGILLPTMWIDPAPFMTSVQLWQSWAIGNNVTFMAANIQLPGYFAVGSGIFHGRQGPLAYTYNPDGMSKLVVATVARSGNRGEEISPNASIIGITKNGFKEYTDDGKDVPIQCSRKILGESKDVKRDYRCLEENTKNYTFVKLDKPKGQVEVCNNGMCCRLDYAAESIEEDFYLGVYNGTYNMFNRYYWCEENCLLVRCDTFGNNPCAIFPMRSNTTFTYVHMDANFTTKHIYPSVLKSGMRLLPLSDWSYKFENGTTTRSKVSLHFESKLGKDLLVVGLNGRCYARDPPYKR